MALIGATIEFDVRRPAIGLDVSEYSDRPQWTVGFELYFGGWHEKVRISTEEDELSKLEGRVGFSVRDEPTPEGEKGQLYYSPGRQDDIFPSPPGYSVSLWLSPEEHGRLVSLVQSGVPLTKLTVSAGEGVEYGWEPDGSGKEWDNKQFPKVSVRGFALQFGTDTSTDTDEDATPPKSILDEPAPVETFTKDALTSLNLMSKQLGWLMLLVGLGVAATIWKA